MKRTNVVIKMIGPLFILSVLVSGCAVEQTGSTGLTLDRSNKQGELLSQLGKLPDLPDWQIQREKITQALGDKVFDKEFGRVFDSLIVALGTMEVQVGGVQRDSGFISAHGSLLRADLAEQLSQESLVERCRYLNFDPSLLDRTPDDLTIDLTALGRYQGAGMTISLVKQSAKQTKVKLRFSQVHYPPLVEELYKAVWPALDKQIFMDQGTD